jgi:GTP cyclohydrolase II
MEFIQPFLSDVEDYRRRTGRPFVTLTYAQSLDGSISARCGVSLALSGRESLKLTHRLRAGHDAILVGIGTVLSDNPRLDVRLVNGKNPRPIIVDSHLRIPLDSRLLTGNAQKPWIVSALDADGNVSEQLEASGANVIRLARTAEGQIDLGAMLDVLGRRGINSLMVEGGARIITSFLMESLADYLVLTIAPVLVGGVRGVNNIGHSRPDHHLRLKNSGHKRLGEDLIVWGELTEETGC